MFISCYASIFLSVYIYKITVLFNDFFFIAVIKTDGHYMKLVSSNG